MIDLIITALLVVPIYLGVALIFFWLFKKENNDHERALSSMTAAGFFLYVVSFMCWAAGCACPL